jgi:N6-L-threonylcarbamoyladenine synthase
MFSAEELLVALRLQAFNRVAMNTKYVFGIESTAHTFSAAVVSDTGEILSDVRDSYQPPQGSGIHPLEAARHHRLVGPGVITDALHKAKVRPTDLSAVAYAMGPGLGPCLRVGAVVARTMALSAGVPLVPVNHAIGHVELGCLLTGALDPLVLLVSGGHTMILAFSSMRWRILGETLDITLGQLLDQLGRHAGLSSPCGRKIEELAALSDLYQTLPYTVKGNDVSFSGILTAAKRLLASGRTLEDVSYSVQETSFAMTVEVLERALAFTEKQELLVVGGVAANRRLSQMARLMVGRHSATFHICPLEFSGDCGAQIAWTGLLAFSSGITVGIGKSIVKQSWRLDSVDAPWREA